MKPFHHLRFIPINKMKKNKTLNKNPTHKSHKKKRTEEPNSNSSSSTLQSCLPVYLTAVNANSADFSVHTQPPLETPKPASSLSKQVKVEEDDKGEKTGRESQSRSPASVTRSSLFTNGDEIIILQGMMEYAKSKNVSLPLANLMDFYPFVKGKLSADVSNSQIYAKIRRLKNKYLKRLNRKSDAPVFSSNHDCEVFNLCKNIWADVERMVVDDADGEPNDMECGDDDKEALSLKYPLLMESLDCDNSFPFSKVDSVKQNMHLIGSEKATELELTWMELRSKESEIQSKKANFKMELIKLVLNAVRGGGEPSSSATARAI